MILELNNSVLLREPAELSLKGKGNTALAENIKISFSKEGLVGFAKNLIWLYEDISSNRNVYFCTDPLGKVPQGNQTLGFFLTPDSPTLTLQINFLDKETGVLCDNAKDIDIRKKSYRQCIEIAQPLDETSIEEYELGLRNMAKIRVISKENEDITKDFFEVFFKINYDGLRDFATMLLILADNYVEGKEYLIAKEKETFEGYNLGIILTQESKKGILGCNDLGCVYDYDINFGNRLL
jgi:hypothetical protein